MARASARPKPGESPSPKAAAFSAVSRSPRSSLPTSAKGRSTGKGVPFLIRFSRSIGKAGSQTETIRDITKLHGPTSRRRHAPAALEREMPSWRPWCRGIEGGAATSLRRDTPAGEGAGEATSLMPGEEQAGGAARLRGKSEASCDDRRLHLDLAENGDEGSRLQPFFQRPGSIRSVPRLNDEDKRGVETEGDEPRAVRRAPFARGPFGQAPEERRGTLPPRQAIADEGKRKGKRRRRVAIGGRLDLMQAVGGKLAPGDLPPPGMGRAGVGVRPNR